MTDSSDSITVQEPITPPFNPPKRSPSPFFDSPTTSTATTLHHTSSSPHLYAESSDGEHDTDTDSPCRPSTSVEIATAIPQPTFTSTAVRLTLTRPIQIRSPSSQSLLRLSRENTPPLVSSDMEKGIRIVQEDVVDVEIDGDSDGDGDMKRNDSRQSVFSIGSHCTNPLRSNPPNPRDTLRYSVLGLNNATAVSPILESSAPLPEATPEQESSPESASITRGIEEKELKRKLKLKMQLRQRWEKVKDRYSYCFQKSGDRRESRNFVF